MLQLSEALVSIPLLCDMHFLVRKVLENGIESVELFMRISKDARLEKEFLKADEHSTLFQTVGFSTTVKDGLQLLEIGIFEDFLNVLVYECIEFLRRTLVKSFKIFACL